MRKRVGCIVAVEDAGSALCVRSVDAAEGVDHGHHVALADEVDGDQVRLPASLGGALFGPLADYVGIVDGLAARASESDEVVDDE